MKRKKEEVSASRATAAGKLAEATKKVEELSIDASAEMKEQVDSEYEMALKSSNECDQLYHEIDERDAGVLAEEEKKLVSDQVLTIVEKLGEVAEQLREVLQARETEIPK